MHDLFGLMYYVPVNSYGYVGMVSSPNHFIPGQAVLKTEEEAWLSS